MLLPIYNPVAKYHANIVTADGATAYLSKTVTLSNAIDSKKFTFGLYLNPAVGFSNSYFLRIFDSGITSSVMDIYFNGTSFSLNAKNAAGSNILAVTSSSLTAGTPYSILGSVDLSSTSNRSIYSNDVDTSPTWTTYTNDIIAFFNVDTTNAKTYIGSNHGTAGFYKGDIADFWFAQDQFIDFSVTANRRKFFDSSNKPVSKGATGLSPTGIAPQLFFTNVAASFGTNSGNGGNFTINGSFSDNGTT